MQGGVDARGRRWVLDRRRKLVRERALWRTGVRFVAGVDEVGMGPLAGPVVAAAVIFPPKVKIDGVRDSKLVTAKRRAELAETIRAAALGVGIGIVEVREIDECNIYQAGLRAMRAAVDALPLPPEHLLVDARRLPDCPCEQTAIVDGDALVYSIAAASIIAKEHRDALMRDLDAVFPGYGFAKHVGYATRAHLEALQRLGPCAAHRQSFAPVRAALRH